MDVSRKTSSWKAREERKTQLRDGSSRKRLYGWKEEVVGFGGGSSNRVQAFCSATERLFIQCLRYPKSRVKFAMDVYNFR
jgi:hypothetical protein